MITIIHGDDIVSSRNYLRGEKNKSENPITLDGSEIDISSLSQNLMGNSLFSSKNTIIIENLFLNKKMLDFDKVVELFKKSNANIYIWEKNELSKSSLGLLKNARVKNFKFPQTLFYFLDSLRPNNKKNLVLFHNALQNTTAEMIFYMLIRQFRLLLSLSNKSSNSIDETKKLAPWQKEKLERQRKLFEVESLKKIYQKLFNIDLKVKTGKITNLPRAIDFFLLEL